MTDDEEDVIIDRDRFPVLFVGVILLFMLITLR